MESGLVSLSKAKSSVRTFVRFSPRKKKELDNNDEQKWNFALGKDGFSIRAYKRSAASKTSFCSVTDNIFMEDVCNSEIYRKMGLQQYALNVLDGISTNIIVCGPHKTGKTHTLVGSQRSIGLVLQVVYDIFAAIRCYSAGIHLNEKGENIDIGGNFDRLFVVKASVLEISENSSNYKIDNVRDLINPENPLQLIKKIEGLGHLIKGDPEHIFEKEEKLVSTILYAVSRKKILDSIRKQKYYGKKKSFPKDIQSSIFGSYGEKWFEDDIVGNLVITITVESGDKSEIENKMTKNSNIANSTNISTGSIRFFEVSSCFNSDLHTKTLVPMFGLLDLAYEIRRYTYTNEKSNKINITNISSYIASTIVESNLLVLATLTESPIEGKCCIRPILAPYDTQSTVQPCSIIDTLKFIDCMGNSMKFSVFPERNCFRRPLIQSKLMEIIRKNVKDCSRSKFDKMIVKSDKGIWKTESSARVTRIIRLLTSINKSTEGCAVLRILMSGNDDDILKIYLENMIGSNLINIEDNNIDNSISRWINNENFRSPIVVNTKKFLYGDKHIKSEESEYNNEISSNDKKQYSKKLINLDNEVNDLNDSKIKNLYFSEKNLIRKSNQINNSKGLANESKIRYDDLLLSEKSKEFDEFNSDDMSNIFNSKNMDENDNTNIYNLNLCEKLKLDTNGSLRKTKSVKNETETESMSSLKKGKLVNFAEEKIGKTCKSLGLIDEGVGRTQELFDLADEGVGGTQKFFDLVDEGVGGTKKFFDLVDEGVGGTHKLLNYTDEEIEVDSDDFNPVKQYEELLEKTKSLNKLQKSIKESHEKYERRMTKSRQDGIYELKIQGREPDRCFPLVNEKALEATQKAVEASKKALEASRNLYEREVKHSRGRVHEVIPESKNFPRVDIYAPPYDSDIDYEYYQVPTKIDFGKNKSNGANDKKLVLSNGEVSNEKVKFNNGCPCCTEYSKFEKCRCHYRDVSVSFVGINETSVNTDKSLLQLYEPGAGLNEKLKPNGRSWDIIFKLPKRACEKKLGFIKRRQQKEINRTINDEFSSSIDSSIEHFDDNIYLDSEENASSDDKSRGYSHLNERFNINDIYSNDKNQINSNIDKMEIETNETNNLTKMAFNNNLFKPIYSKIENNNNRIFNRTFSKKGKSNLETKHIQPNFNKHHYGRYFTANDKISDNNIVKHSNNHHVESESHLKLDFINHSGESIGLNESEDFEIFNSNIKKDVYSKNSVNDVFLEKIEEDINNQMNEFSNIPSKINTKSKQIREDIYAYSSEEFSELNNYINKSYHTNEKIPMEEVIKESGCCHVKYILPFPKELQPKIIRGEQNYIFPYLKPLY